MCAVAEAVVGRFTLVDPIGRGATGQVWRAYDHRARRYCAAKVFRQRDAGGLIRVVREQGVRLHHPHVVCPYAWAADDGDVVIAMELMRGGSLQTLIRDHGALPPPYAARIAGQLLSALRHVHEAELLHRDVKPGNVLLEATGTGEPQARLADFGIALQVYEAPVTDTGVILGTPGYLPPEAYEELPGPGPRRLRTRGRRAPDAHRGGLTGEERGPSGGRAAERCSADAVGRRTGDVPPGPRPPPGQCTGGRGTAHHGVPSAGGPRVQRGRRAHRGVRPARAAARELRARGAGGPVRRRAAVARRRPSAPPCAGPAGPSGVPRARGTGRDADSRRGGGRLLAARPRHAG